MKTHALHRIALAAFAITAGSAAQAQNIERLAGASASQINVVRGLQNLCGGTFAVIKQTSSVSSLGNLITMTCSANFTGTSTNQVRMNVSGGTLSAVQSAAGLTGTAPVSLIDPSATSACTTLGAGTGPLSFLTAGQLINCGTTGQVSEFTNGGYMDVDGSIFRATGQTIPPEVDDSVDYPNSPFFQAFGLGISSALYNALQAYQTAIGTLPSTCATSSVSGSVTTFTATGSTLPGCQPSVAKAAITALMASGNNQVKKAGANALIDGTASAKNGLSSTQAISPDVPLKSTVFYCRRPTTSGTQAGAQLYFLNNPTGTGELGGQLVVVGSPTAPGTVNVGTTFTASTGSGTSDLKTCLNTNTYAVGLLSAENNPIGGSDTYKFAKLNGAWISEGVANSGQAAEAVAGRYDYVFQTVQFCHGGASSCTPILTALSSAVPAGSSSPGLFLQTESNFTRAKATTPYTAKP